MVLTLPYVHSTSSNRIKTCWIWALEEKCYNNNKVNMMRQNVFNSVFLGATFLYKLIWVFLKSLVIKISCVPQTLRDLPADPVCISKADYQKRINKYSFFPCRISWSTPSNLQEWPVHMCLCAAVFAPSCKMQWGWRLHGWKWWN